MCERKVVSSRLPARVWRCLDSARALTQRQQHSLHLAAAWEHSGPNPGTARGTLQHPLVPELPREPWESRAHRVAEPAAATAVTQLLGCQLILGLVCTGQKLGSPSLAPLLPWERRPAASQCASPAVQGMSCTRRNCQTSQDEEPCNAQAAPAPSLPCPRTTQ